MTFDFSKHNWVFDRGDGSAAIAAGRVAPPQTRSGHCRAIEAKNKSPGHHNDHSQEKRSLFLVQNVSRHNRS